MRVLNQWRTGFLSIRSQKPMGWVKFQAHPTDLGVFLTTQSMRILLGEKNRSRKKSELARSHTVSMRKKKVN